MKTAMLLFIVYLFCYAGNGQAKKINQGSIAIFNGTISDGTGDTVCAYYAGSFYDCFIGFKSKSQVTVDGSFRFEIPVTNEFPNRISLVIKKNNRYWTITQNSQIVEAGDSVTLSVVKGTGKRAVANYSGRGASKYNCWQEIKNSELSLDSTYTLESEADHYLEKINRDYQLRNAAYTKIYRKYKATVPAKILKTIETDVAGHERGVAYNNAYLVFSSLIAKNPGLPIPAFFSDFGKEDSGLMPYMAYSFDSYLDFIIDRTATFARFQKKEHGISFVDLYKGIVPRYHGLLKECLVSKIFFFGNNLEVAVSPQVMSSLWIEGNKVVHHKELKKLFAVELDRKAKSKMAFDFRLPDDKGNLVNLHDFRGKIVLMDFWYTGCGGCASYSHGLEKKVYPYFDKDTSVVFISVCGDEKMETWLGSIPTKKYTRPENINLYTEGLGFEHPLTQYYDFNGGPYSLLIDRKGRIFSGSPPKMDMQQLIQLINDAKMMDD